MTSNDKYGDVLLIASVALSLTSVLFLVCIYVYMLTQEYCYHKPDIFTECYREF